jgi:hypothetical protein
VIAQQSKKRQAVDDFLSEFGVPAKKNKNVVPENRGVPEKSAPREKKSKVAEEGSFVIDTVGDAALKAVLSEPVDPSKPVDPPKPVEKKKKKPKAKSYLDDL